MRYRAEIDGLRAIAVVPVVFFHAGFDLFRGGFVGVDVFFVISGYLITTIICSEMAEGTFSFARFYERRARRILPALVLVMAACILFGWFWMLPREFDELSKSVAAASLFVSNFFFWSQSGYFDTASELKPLLHTWSLAIEEQFYILFPLALLATWKYGRAAVISAIGVCFVLSLALCQHESRIDPFFDFYLAPTRVWELAAGALASFVSMKRRPALDSVLSILGLGLILAAVFLFGKTTPFPSLYALVPVIGAGLVLVFAVKGTPGARILSHPLPVGIGLVSYSLYLWHQPVLAFARLRLQAVPTATESLLLLALTAALAVLTWRYVETPFRDIRRFSRRAIFANAGLAALSLLAFAAVTAATGGLPGRYSPEMAALASELDYRVPRASECFGDVLTFVPPEKSCLYNEGRGRRVVIWGDSHSAALANDLAEQLNDARVALQQFSFSGCPPILGVHFAEIERQLCPEYNRLVFDYLKRHEELKDIILVARWPVYFDGFGYDNGEGGVKEGGKKFLLALPASKGLDYYEDSGRVATVGAIFRESIETLLAMGRNVTLVYPLPEAGRDVAPYVARSRLYGATSDAPFSVSYAFFRERTAAVVEQLDMLGENPALLRVRPAELFCNGPVSGRCILERDGLPLFADDNHVNKHGATLVARQIVAAMKARGWL
ncbi:acyltransferase family protein [Methylocystis sp. IM3]|uniref:acyltransferase family protein n=1 Tax=unclassified Methylocystis TaxID=2625913 RepID=UPI000F98790E|nr:MAG: acyltransferase [Hyphomicrobiales bacterium]